MAVVASPLSPFFQERWYQHCKFTPTWMVYCQHGGRAFTGEVRRWCYDNAEGQVWPGGSEILFELEADAMLFKLRWGDLT